MTFNAKVGNALAGGGIGAGALAAEVARHDPDIVVLQDANGLLLDRGAPALEGGPPLFGLPHVFALGQYVVASRLPLRGCAPGQIGFGVEQHRYLRCAVDVHGKTLTVVTAHFKSPRDGLSATRHAGLDGAGEWEENFSDRLEQARALARDVATMPRPLVVAGDLNAPDDSPVVQALLAAGLADSFSTSGRGFGFTYGHSMRAGLSFLRIDHILASRDVTVVDSFVGEGRASEHRPVIADLILGDSPNQGELL